MGSSKIPPPREGLIAEVKLLAGVKKGKDLNAFQNRHVAPLWPVARLLCADDATATEVLMAALSQALTASGTWSSELPLGVWLRRRLVSYWLLREKRAGLIVETPARGRRRGRRGGRARDKPHTGRPAPNLSFDVEGRLLAAPAASWRHDDHGETAATESATTETAGTESAAIETAATENAGTDVDASRSTALRLASTRLPPSLRLAWVLCDVCGEEPVATGEALDISTGMILSRLHRARILLLGRIDGETPTRTAGREDTPAGPTCQEVVGMLWLEPEDGIPGELQEGFRAHLDSCETCTDLRASYRALIDGAAMLRPGSVPDDLTDGVRAVVDQLQKDAAAAEEQAETAAESGDTSDRPRSSRSRRPAGRRESPTGDGADSRRSDTTPAPSAGSERTTEAAPPASAASEKSTGSAATKAAADENADGKSGESSGEGARRGSRRRRGRRNRSRKRPPQS